MIPRSINIICGVCENMLKKNQWMRTRETISLHGLWGICVNYETINQFHHFCPFAHHISNKYINYVTVADLVEQGFCTRTMKNKRSFIEWHRE